MNRIITILISIAITISSCAKNTALLVGIGAYDGKTTGWTVIHGNNDVSLLSSKLKKKGFSIKTLTDKQATKANVTKALKSLVTNATSGDVIYLHFSGHGQLIDDLNKDEASSFDQSFVCYDACFSSNFNFGGKKYRGQNHLIDDEIFPYLNDLKGKVGPKGQIIVVFDSCYSGGADRNGNSEVQPEDSEVDWLNTTRGTDDEFPANKVTTPYLSTIKAPGKYTGQGQLLIISACESEERNSECKDRYSGKAYGSLSYCIGKLLDMKIQFTDWFSFFNDKKYNSLKIFRPSQHPAIERH